MESNYRRKNLFKNSSLETRKAKDNTAKYINKGNNSKGKINRKYIIKHCKLKILSLSKYINKANYNNKKYDNNINYRAIKKNILDENDINNTINSHHTYKDRFNINFTNYKFDYFSKYYTDRNKKQNSFEKKINYTIINNNYVDYDINKKRMKSSFLFPDKRFVQMKKLNNEKILKNLYKKYNKKIFKCKDSNNIYNINIKKIEDSNIENYFMNISTLIRNKEDEKHIYANNSKANNLKASIDQKNNKDNYNNKYIIKNWILFPFKLDKYIKSKILNNYGNLLFDELHRIYKDKIKYDKKYKLLRIIRNGNIKNLKYYFRKFRDNTLIEKVKQIYQNKYIRNANSKNIKIKQKNKKRKKVEMFLTKTTNKTINNNLYINRINLFIDKLRLILFKKSMKDYYIYLKAYLINKYNIKSDKLLNNNEIENEKKRTKKHIKVKYIRRNSQPNMKRNEYSISIKTSSSDYSKSTINSAKKMKVYKRVVKDNLNNNNLTNKMYNIMIKSYKKEIKQYFYKWNNIALNCNEKRKNFDKRFFYYFLTKLFYYNKNLKVLDFSLLLGYSMYIWKRSVSNK